MPVYSGVFKPTIRQNNTLISFKNTLNLFLMAILPGIEYKAAQHHKSQADYPVYGPDIYG